MVDNYFKKINILESFLGECSYKHPHPEIAFYCPNCHHRKKKLMINLEKNYYKCWVCGKVFAGKSIIPLINKYGNQSQLREWLSLTHEKQLDIDLKSMIENSLTSEVVKEKVEIIKLPDECKDILNNDLYINPFKRYLNTRKINDKLIEKYKLKCCAEGQYRNRVIIPSFDVNGDINYFIARNIYKEGLKYLNPNVKKNLIIFNEMFISWNDPIIIVEGVFDSIKVDYNCVPLLGSSLESSSLKDKLIENQSIVYLMLDADAYSKQIEAIEMFMKFGLKVYNVIVDKKDPGSMTRQEILNKIREAKLIDENEIIKAKLL